MYTVNQIIMLYLEVNLCHKKENEITTVFFIILMA